MNKEVINELIKQARNGSNKAFNKLYLQYKQVIWGTIYNIVKNIDVTDDLTSTVFIKAYEKLSSYIQNISFEMWLKTIAVNSAIDYIRKNKKENLNSYIDDEECTVQVKELSNSPEETLVNSEQLKLVQDIISTLQKKYRDLIEMKLEGMSYKDISEKLAISEAKVKATLSKARLQIKRKLSKIN